MSNGRKWNTQAPEKTQYLDYKMTHCDKMVRSSEACCKRKSIGKCYLCGSTVWSSDHYADMANNWGVYHVRCASNYGNY